MRIVIKNPAPLGEKLIKWGDYHFGRSLSKYLERLGCEVVTHYHQDWQMASPADVVLVLRGRHPYTVQKGSGPLHVMWNISHPEDVRDEEYAQYDIVLIA